MLELHVPGRPGSEGGGLRGGECPEDRWMMLLESGSETAAEARRERSEMYEKCIFVRVYDLVFIRIESKSWNDAVNVRMLLHLTAPGMKD